MVSSQKVSIAKALKISSKTSMKIEKKTKKLSKKVLPDILRKEISDPEPKNTETVKKIKNVLPTKYITEKVVDSGLLALQQLTEHHKKTNVLFEDEQPIFAEIHCIKIQNTSGNIKFVLPHSTVASTGEVCLITPDLKKGKKVDHDPTVDHWVENLKKSGVTEVKTILPMRQLKVEYDQFELKRRLLTQHDFIMVDTRVLSHVSHILGKMFFKKHNMLIPVRIQNETDLKKEIDTGLRTVMLRLSEGQTSTLLIGHTGMSQEKLKENILSFVQQIKTRFPGGEANIRSISIKLPLSMSLPLYITLRSSDTIKPPKLLQKRPKNFKAVEDEVTTVSGKVRVHPDGTVRLVKKKSKKSEISVIESDGEDNEKQADDTTDSD